MTLGLGLGLGLGLCFSLGLELKLGLRLGLVLVLGLDLLGNHCLLVSGFVKNKIGILMYACVHFLLRSTSFGGQAGSSLIWPRPETKIRAPARGLFRLGLELGLVSGCAERLEASPILHMRAYGAYLTRLLRRALAWLWTVLGLRLGPRPGLSLSLGLVLVLGIGLGFCGRLEASRIKDITTVEGLRDNQLIGYGIVVGLSGTGDSSLAYTNASIANTLKHFGINPENADSKNIAAVMVTTDIAPFTKPGSRIDVTVSSIGNCKTLQGGVLLQTPLEGADEIVYAVAQGPLAVGGFLGGTSGGEGQGSASVQQNHPTVARIAGGAIVEREIITDLGNDHSLGLILRNPDYTCAVRIADTLNKAFSGIAKAENPNLVHLSIPEDYHGQELNFLALIGELEVFPDLPARIIINERTGTIVATANVRLSRVAVSHGSLTISISSTAEASQPSPLSQSGDTTVVNNSQVSVNEVKGGFQVLGEFPTIERLTSALNALGVSSREMMSILQSIKNAGALQAELIVN